MECHDAFMYGAALGVAQNRIEMPSYEEELIFNSLCMSLFDLLWCYRVSVSLDKEDFTEKVPQLREAFWILMNEKDRIEEEAYAKV